MGDGDRSYRVLGGGGGSIACDDRGCLGVLVACGDACLDGLNGEWVIGVNELESE